MDKENTTVDHRRGKKRRLYLTAHRKKRNWNKGKKLWIGDSGKLMKMSIVNENVQVPITFGENSEQPLSETKLMEMSNVGENVHLHVPIASQENSEQELSETYNLDFSNTSFETGDVYTSLPPLVIDNSTDHTSSNIDGLPIFGRRMVDIGHLFRTILETNHENGLDCNFMNMYPTKERRNGFETIWTFKCKMCKIELNISSEDNANKHTYMDINSAAVNGIIATGNGYSQLSELTSALDIPCMSSLTFLKYQKKVALAIHDSAWLAMEEAGKEEAELAKSENNVDKDGVPLVTVVADGQWCKRSYKTNYDSLSGVASIVGHKTKKVLFIGIRNRYCSVCAKAKGVEVGNHQCFLNWNKSATSMEADIISEGFRQSMSMHGVKYNKLIGDGDSSVTKRLGEILPYGSEMAVEKIECTNHVLRNYSNKISDISKQTKAGYPVQIRNRLKNSQVRLRSAITKAIDYRKKQKEPLSFRISELKRDIENGPYHVFGQHDECAQRGYFCTGTKETEENLVPEMQSCKILDELLIAVRRVSRLASSLILNVTNNSCEQFNSVVNKFINGKRVNYSLRGSYTTRCEASVVSHNTSGQYLRMIHKTMMNDKSPGYYTKQYVRRKSQALECASKRRLEFKMEGRNPPVKRKKVSCGPDQDYGLLEEEYPLAMDDDEHLVKNMKSFLNNLSLTEVQRNQLERDTVEQSSCPKWRIERMKRLTASNFGKICHLKSATSRKNTVHALLYCSVGTKAMQYGIDNEPFAKAMLQLQINIDVTNCGLFVDKDQPFLAASPDGLVGDDEIVEVKCPMVISDSENLSSAAASGKISFCNYVDGKLILKKNHNYFFQVQGQLHITKRKFCYFVIYAKKWISIEKIERDDDFWQDKMCDKLERFYKESLLPEIVDSRYKFRLLKNDIREKVYINMD